MAGDGYGGWKGAHAHGEAVLWEEAMRLDLERRAKWQLRPEVVAQENRRAEKRTRRKRAKPEPNTDYPWLKPGWKW